MDRVLAQVQAGQVSLGDTGVGAVRSDHTTARIETPYLQLVMMRLWDEEARRGSRQVRLATLEELGGAPRIVRTHLDATMATLTAPQQEIAARLFRHLVTPSGTKIAHTVADLATYAELPVADLVPVLERLAAADLRILRPVAPPPDQPATPRYEIFHDVLAAAILDWCARYVEAARQAVAERQLQHARRRTRRFAVGMGIAVTLLLVMVGLTIFAFQQRATARRAQTESMAQRARAENERARAEAEKSRAETARAEAEAERAQAQAAQSAAEVSAASARRAEASAQRQAELAESRELAARAVSHLDSDIAHGAWLALAAIHRSKTNEAVTALSRVAQLLEHSRSRLTLTGHTEWVMGVAFSPDGRWVATASRDKTARVWDATTGQTRVTLTGHTAGVSGVAFSPDGRWVATASADGTARVWDATTGQTRVTLTGHTARVSGVAFSPDGRWVATASHDKTARVWDATTGQTRGVTLTGHTSPVWSVAFSPDGRWVATASTGGDKGEEGILEWGPTTSEDLVVLVRSRLLRSLGADECRQLFGPAGCPSVGQPSPSR